jgi:hypothetical protein
LVDPASNATQFVRVYQGGDFLPRGCVRVPALFFKPLDYFIAVADLREKRRELFCELALSNWHVKP